MTYQILNGDALAMLRTLPDQSVHCCVTSPPYWGLRDYGTGDAQIGLEDTPDAYVARLVAVFDEVRRVLRDDGTLWLNLGDSYAGNRGNTLDNPGYDNKAANGNNGLAIFRNRKDVGGLKPKDLVGIPWRVAFALQAAGWWLRSDIVWAKGLSFCPTYAGSAMPESVTDRPTKGHEYLFLLTKSARYFYDNEAVKEQSTGQSGAAVDFARTSKDALIPNQGYTQHRNGRTPTADNGKRNLRTVWAINPGSYPEAHFATFPPALVEPCILAGTSAHGVCPACGAPWVRVVERTAMEVRTSTKGQIKHDDGLRTSTSGTMVKPPTSTTTGWRPSCDCDAGDPIPATVLDPFAGSGTTLAVAVQHKRSAIGVELNPEYVELIHKRLGKVQPRLFNL